MSEMETRSESSQEEKKEEPVVVVDSKRRYQRKQTAMEFPTTVLNPQNEISYKDVNEILRKSYQLDDSDDSVALDILALYLKGQKIIYTESKTFCEQRLNALMLPAIFIAALCSILNFILKDHPSGTIIISSLNAFNSFLLSVISYLKLDAKAESHKMAAHKFQKLESMCEFHSGKALIFKDSVDVYSFVDKIEGQVMDIRESNQFIIPEDVRLRYPKISVMNVFTIVKEIGNNEIIVVNKLKNAVQKLHLAVQAEKKTKEERDKRCDQLAEWEQQRMDGVTLTKEDEEMYQQVSAEVQMYIVTLEQIKKEIEELDGQKNVAFEEVVRHRTKYLKLSETYMDEIREQNQAKRMECSPYNWCKT